MTFSIIIPTYNAADLLRQCLDSIAAQTFRNVEILIVDADSGDDTIIIAREYQLAGQPIRIITEKDKGIYDAMNKGILASRGDWIYFMGSDDRLFDAKVLETVQSKITAGDELLYGDCEWLPEKVREQGPCSYAKLLNRSINHQRIFYKCTLFEAIKPFNLDYKIAADYELNIRLFCNPGVIKRYMSLPIAYYHSGGFSADKVDEPFWDNWENILLKSFKPHLPETQVYERLAWYCWYKIRQRKYAEGIKLFANIFRHTRSFRFVKHTASQTIKSISTQ